MFFLLMMITAVPAYVLGSVNGAIITSKMLYRKDIRNFGSGNPGLTNFYRTFGLGGFILVVIIDVVKTIAPVLLGGWLFANFTTTDMLLTEVGPLYRFIDLAYFGQVLAGFFVMLGHCFPLFYKFKGGKGITAIGCIVIMVDWQLALISWGVFILITAITRYVSLGAMLGSVAFSASMFLFNIGGMAEHTIVIMCVLLVIVRHIPNIKRLIKGQESKFKLKRSKEQKQ